MYMKKLFSCTSNIGHHILFGKFQKTKNSYICYLRKFISDSPSKNLSHINEKVSAITPIASLVKTASTYSYRTHTCGELRLGNVGEKVILCGWLQYQRLKRFIVIRDGYGVTQLIIKENDVNLQNLFYSLPYESIVKIEGVVVARPTDMINTKQETGSVEVLIDQVVILNKANENLPFNLREYQKPKEPLRMQYRYIDLRFPEMQFNLRTRSQMLMNMRDYLINKANFVDVETPTLFRATPGGAQEFIVPTRFPGQFYSLVQSPQQFKQMLMAGAIDRYFQIARCYRDEGSRPDRQPEFTQLDIEMSFTDVEGVMELVERLLQYSWPKFLDPLPITFNRMSYRDAMEKYGCDKPDTRFDFQLQDVTDILRSMNTLDLPNFYASCLVIKQECSFHSNAKKKLRKLSKDYPTVKFIQVKIQSPLSSMEYMSRKLSAVVVSDLWDKCAIEEGNIVFLACGPKSETLALMGKIRVEYANLLEEEGRIVKNDGMEMLWITDFPLFEMDNEGNLQSVHHPFTSPHPEDLDMLETSPLTVRSLAYDLVLNGNEVGGGSVRIHDPFLQRRVLKLLKIHTSTLEHMLHMLSSGCPPHGGIALGLDRLLCTVLKTQSIRDVIAFPKTFEGRDPISGAPSEITQKEKLMYHITTTS